MSPAPVCYSWIFSFFFSSRFQICQASLKSSNSEHETVFISCASIYRYSKNRHRLAAQECRSCAAREIFYSKTCFLLANAAGRNGRPCGRATRISCFVRASFIRSFHTEPFLPWAMLCQLRGALLFVLLLSTGASKRRIYCYNGTHVLRATRR